MVLLQPQWIKFRLYGHDYEPFPQSDSSVPNANSSQGFVLSVRWLLAAISAVLLIAAGVQYTSFWHFVGNTDGPHQAGPENVSMRRICIVMHNSNDTAMFNSTTFGSNVNHQDYARIHGYHFRFSSHPYIDFDQRKIKNGYVKSSGAHGYNKLIELQAAVLHGMQTKEFDWVFWADGDTWIVNPSILLESYLPPQEMWDAAPEPYFLASPDENGFNDGTFFMRANYWSYSFLAQTFADLYQPIDAARYQGYSDQRSICRALANDPAAAAHFYRCPQHWFNLYPGVIDDAERDHEVKEDTLQVHLVDRLHRDEALFAANIQRVQESWQYALTETTRLSGRTFEGSEDAIYRSSVDVLNANRLAEAGADNYWKTEAISGVEGLKWLDIQ